MQKYERTIGLKTIFLTLRRRFVAIIAIFIPIALASFLVTKKMIHPVYTSSVTISRGAAISQPQYNLIVQNFKATSTADKVVEALTITHEGGDAITSAEISSGLSFSTYVANAISVTLSFQSTDSSICQGVLDQVVATGIEVMQTVHATDYAALKATGSASSPTSDNKQRNYFLIGLAAGAVLALGMPFVYEIVADEVFDKGDLLDMGIPTFELKASK